HAWYWYELGVRNQKRDVEVRAQVLDEKRRVVAAFGSVLDPRPGRACLIGGPIALWGPAEFGDVYADPWEARWVDDPANCFTWKPVDGQTGPYYLVAEVAEPRLQPAVVVSK